MAFEFVGQTIKAQVTKGVTAVRQAAVGTAEEYLGPKAISTMGDLYSKAASKLGEQIKESQGQSTYEMVQAIGTVNESTGDLRSAIITTGEQSEFQLKKLRGDRDGIGGLFGQLFSKGGIKNMVASIIPMLGSALAFAAPAIALAAAGAIGFAIGTFLNKLIDKAFGETGGLGKWVFDFLHDPETGVFPRVGKLFGDAWAGAKAFVGDITGTVGGWITGGLEIIGDKISSTFDKVEEISKTIF